MTGTPKEIRIENGVGTVVYQDADTTITYDPTNDYTIISGNDSLKELDLPNISALTPYNGYPDNLAQIPTPISDTEAKYRTEYGEETQPDNIEAQTLVASLVGLGYGSSPAGPFNGDGCTIYSHVDTEDGTDAEVRALIFRSTKEGTDPNISDRGAIACWASSTLLSSTATPLPVIDMDNGENTTYAFVTLDDYVDLPGAQKLFSIYLNDTEKRTEEQEEQYSRLLATIIAQWLQPDYEAIRTVREAEKRRLEPLRAKAKAEAEARKAKTAQRAK